MRQRTTLLPRLHLKAGENTGNVIADWHTAKMVTFEKSCRKQVAMSCWNFVLLFLMKTLPTTSNGNKLHYVEVLSRSWTYLQKSQKRSTTFTNSVGLFQLLAKCYAPTRFLLQIKSKQLRQCNSCNMVLTAIHWKRCAIDMVILWKICWMMPQEFETRTVRPWLLCNGTSCGEGIHHGNENK